jgi:ABC-type polysaccharide/polyol phosphate export permease
MRVNIITRIKINPYTLAQGTLGASVFNFFMTLIPFFMLVLFNRGFSPRVLFLFPLICVMMFFLFGVGLALAILYTLFDDLKAIVRIVFSFIPFLTPIFYKLDQLPVNLQLWITASPFTNFLVLFRWCVGGSENLQISVVWSLLFSLMFSFVCMVFFDKKWNRVVKLL